jgi:hypothetical protein
MNDVSSHLCKKELAHTSQLIEDWKFLSIFPILELSERILPYMKRIVTAEANTIEISDSLEDTQAVVDTFGSMIEAVLQHSADHSHFPDYEVPGSASYSCGSEGFPCSKHRLRTIRVL